ncbi:MAG: endopeptidase La, partial [Oscillospiraceae bacterium]|nr:endopeptidase La [Oscillospiraceae bacterium]
EHLLKKQLLANGMEKGRLKIADKALKDIIRFYTREAGVRVLEREIATLCRKAAKKIVSDDVKKVSFSDKNLEEFLGPKKYRPETILENDEVGVVTGLAWTSVGGETMQIEVSIMDGTGKIELTGSLGDVMKESAKTAISYVRTRADEFSIDKEFYKNKDIHIHAPEGAVPKDGPSAGVTMTTAIISALTGIPVRREVAMTGEVTLRGRVLTIGGLKEKTMAAYRSGVKTVIIPKDNVPDLAEVEEVVKQNINFVPADNMDIVLKTALCYMPTKKSGGETDDIGGIAKEDNSFIIPKQENAEVVCIKN